MMPIVSCGEIWTVNLNPTKGHEQRGIRPGLVISIDYFNRSPAGLVVIIPLTIRQRNIPLHVQMDPSDGGAKQTSFIMCDNMRAISKERLIERWGTVSPEVMEEVKDRLRLLFDI